MALTEQQRQQLNSVIFRMKQDRRTEPEIQEAVNQFKAKYDKPTAQERNAQITARNNRPAGEVLKTGLETGKGVLKGGAGILAGLADILGGPGTSPQLQSIKDRLKPTNIDQQVGSGVTNVLATLLPQGAIGRGVQAAGAAAKLPQLGRFANTASLLARAGTEGVAQATLAGATGQENAGTTGLIAAGTLGGLGLLGGAGRKVLSAAQPLAKKIEDTVLRPTLKDIEDGFKIENVFKYKVGGSVEDAVSKTQQQIENLYGQVKEKIGSTNTTVNLSNVLAKVEKDLGSASAKTFGSNQSIQRAIASAKEELNMIAPFGGVDLPTAQQIKQASAKLGAFKFGANDPDSTAQEAVYTAIYRELKKVIEDASPAGVRELNKQISELIPIQTAAIRRLPVEQRNNVLGLGDLISIGSFSVQPNLGSMLLYLANRLQKSGRFASGLYDMGSAARNATGPSAIEKLLGR